MAASAAPMVASGQKPSRRLRVLQREAAGKGVPLKLKLAVKFGVMAASCLVGLGLASMLGLRGDGAALAGSTPSRALETVAEGGLSDMDMEVHSARWLEDAEDCGNLLPFDENGTFLVQGKGVCDEFKSYLPLAIFVVVYMFWALAIVVDEKFVSCLDYIVWELQISEDVAGATFMAAGGSAPEFFTNLISTLAQTSTGFGTIVGSAVFNILFVISMSAFFSRDRHEVIRRRESREKGVIITDPWPYKPLELSWWPLLRDSTVYIFSLIVLAFFYFCFSTVAGAPTCSLSEDGEIQYWEATILFLIYVGYCTLMAFQEPVKSFVKKKLPWLIPKKQRELVKSLTRADANELSTDVDMEASPATATVKPAASGTDFESGEHEPKLKKLQKQLSTAFVAGEEATPSNVMSRRALVVNGDVGRRRGSTLGRGVSQNSLGRTASAAQTSTLDTLDEGDGNGGGQDDDDMSDDSTLVVEPRMRPLVFWLPDEDVKTWAKVLNATLYILSVPILLTNGLVWFGFDSLTAMENDHQRRAAGAYSFFMSLIVIAIYTFFMVFEAESFANTVGIDEAILGFTLLAAGTSTPDLLSSVLVARMGYGDMAVSSSIGSNIFDICVGIPIPSLIAMAVNKTPLAVETGAVGYSLAVIIAMVASLIAIIVWQDWKLTTRAAQAMIGLYFVFLLIIVLAESL